MKFSSHNSETSDCEEDPTEATLIYETKQVDQKSSDDHQYRNKKAYSPETKKRNQNNERINYKKVFIIILSNLNGSAKPYQL